MTEFRYVVKCSGDIKAFSPLKDKKSAHVQLHDILYWFVNLQRKNMSFINL